MYMNWKSRHLTIALALILSAAGAAPIALASNADAAAPTNSGSAASEASSGGASSPAKANAPAPADPNSPVLLELRDLKATIQAQADQVNAHTLELESEREIG